jgi:hypothetical protein
MEPVDGLNGIVEPEELHMNAGVADSHLIS